MTREEFLTFLIRDRKYSVKSFAKEIDIPYSTLRSILDGNVGGASVDNVIKICKGLNITIDELNNCSCSNAGITLSEHEEELIIAYRTQPSAQPFVDRALGIESDIKKESLA